MYRYRAAASFYVLAHVFQRVLEVSEGGEQAIAAACTENPRRRRGGTRNPVFDVGDIKQMVDDGIQKLTATQWSDGRLGLVLRLGQAFLAVVVVHGLQIAKENGAVLPDGMLERGISWPQSYQDRHLQLIKNAPTKTLPWKDHADELDAFVYMVLADSGHKDNNMSDMRDFLYRDRTKIAVYAKAMFGLALHKAQGQLRRDQDQGRGLNHRET